MKSISFFLLFLLLSVPCFADSGDNRIKNPSFDKDNNGWVFWKAARDKEINRPGGSPGSAKFESNDNKTRRMIHQNVILNQTKAMPILFGAWSKSEGVPAGKKAVMYIAVYFQDGTEFWQAPSISFSSKEDWERRECSYIPTKPVKRITLYAEFNSSPGTVWIDDVFVNVMKPRKTAGPCKLTETAGCLVLENSFFELVLDPAKGGSCKKFIDKRSGASFTSQDIDLAMFTDRLRELGKEALFQSNFGYKVLMNSEETVRVELSLPSLPNFAFLGVKKIFTLERNSARLKISYVYYNEPAAMAPVVISPYFRSGVSVKDEATTFFMPCPEGVKQFMNTAGGEPKASDAVQGWTAASGSSGRGIACEFALSHVDALYFWLGGKNMSTIEWWSFPINIKNGESYTTEVDWIPYSGMKNVDNVENGIVGSFVKKQSGYEYQFYSSIPAMLTTEITAEYSEGKRLTETGSISLDPAANSRLPIKFPVNSSLKTITVSLLQNGRKCFETVKAFDHNYRFAPRTAKVPPAEVKPFQMVLSKEVETPHVPWSTPYYKGTIKALVLNNLAKAREIVELMQRMDINCNTVRFSDVNQEMNFFHAERYLNFSYNDANISLKDALQSKYDVIIISGGMWKFFNEENIRRIKEKLEAGTGLVLINSSSVPKEILPYTPLAGNKRTPGGDITGNEIKSEKLLLPLTVWPSMSIWKYQFAPDTQTILSARGIPLVVKNKRNNYHIAYNGQGTLLPALPYYAAFPSFNYPDYQFQPLIKAILDAAGKKPDSTISKIEVKDEKLNITLSGTVPAGKLSVHIMMQNLLSGKKVGTTCEPLTGINDFTLPLPAKLTPGINVVDVIVYIDGKAIDFAGCSVSRAAPAKITSLKADTGKSYQIGDTIQGEITMSGTNTARVFLKDTWGRILAEKNVPNGSFELVIPEASSVRMYLEAELSCNGDVADKKILPLYVHKPFQENDFVLSLGDHNWAYGVNRYFHTYGFYPQMQKFGFNMLRVWVNNNEQVLDDMLRHNIFITFPIGGSTASDFGKQQKLYNQTKDKKYLCRKPCLNETKKIEASFAGIGTRVRKLLKYSPSSLYFSDENSLTAWATPFDFCFCDQTIKEFREWLKIQYPDLSALNAEWDTTFSSWNDVIPCTTEEIKKKAKETRNYAAWADHRRFMDLSFTGYFTRLAKSARENGQNIALDISGTSEPTAYDGMDWWPFSKFLQHSSFYRLKANDDVMASFNDIRGTGWFGYGEKGDSVKYMVWHDAFRFRKAGASFYEACNILNPDFTIPQATADFVNSVKDLRFGIGRLLETLEKEKPQVLIHYSMASIRSHDLEGRMPEYIAARIGWMDLLHDLNIPYKFFSYEEIEQRKLLDSPARILILPYSIALSQQETEKIMEFASKGGLVIGDRMTGIMNEHSRLLPKGQLDHLFGLSKPDTAEKGIQRFSVGENSFSLQTGNASGKTPGQAAFFRNKYGEGSGIFLNTLLSGYSSLRRVPEKKEEADKYLSVVHSLMKDFLPESGLQLKYSDNRIPLVRSFVYESKKENDAKFIGLLRETGNFSPVEIKLETPSNLHVYSVRDRKYLGSQKETTVKIENADALLLALMPYEIQGVAVTIPESIRQGDTLQFRLEISADGNKLDHPCRLEVYSPDGTLYPYYSKNITAENGTYEGNIFFALNDQPGEWRISIRDIISGKTTEKKFTLNKSSDSSK